MSNCPICETNADEAFTVSFMNGKPHLDKVYVDFPVTYMKCPKCGCHFSKEQQEWTSEDFAHNCYNDDYWHYDSDINNHLGNRPTFHKNLFSTMFSAFRNKRILDYGCGKGFAVSHLKEQGLDIYGYDPYFGAYKQMPDGKFDLITAFEVLEHSYNINDIFKMWHDRLNDGGIVYATTDLTDRMANIQTNYYTCPRVGHVVLHSLRSLKYIAEIHGFNVIHLDRHEKTGIQAHIFTKI